MSTQIRQGQGSQPGGGGRVGCQSSKYPILLIRDVHLSATRVEGHIKRTRQIGIQARGRTSVAGEKILLTEQGNRCNCRWNRLIGQIQRSVLRSRL